jgi:hypothetical protein
LRNDVRILGGFDTGEVDYQERDPFANVTILSGEIQQDSNITNNSYHVVLGELLDQTAVIDGFTITAGNANPAGSIPVPDPQCPGTIICPPLTACAFGLDPLLDGEIGGGMLLLGVPGPDNCGVCSPLVMRCTFDGNRAGKQGGAVFYSASQLAGPIFGNCTFKGNESELGAAVAINAGGGGQAGVKLLNCLMVDNTAAVDGSAVWVLATNGVTLINCTVADNACVASGGAAVVTSEACDTQGQVRQGAPTLINTIVYGNVRNASGTPTTVEAQLSGYTIIHACCIEGFDVNDPDSYCREGGTAPNYDDDPLFIDAPNDYRLASNSPVIDLGLTATIEIEGDLADVDQDGQVNDTAPDLDGLARVSSANDCKVDLGSYERQVSTNCLGDVDGDCDRDVDDLIAVILGWGACTQPPCEEDFIPTPCNPDGEVNSDELISIILNWGSCTNCTPTGTGFGVDPEDYGDCQTACMEFDGEQWITCMQSCLNYLCVVKEKLEYCE